MSEVNWVPLGEVVELTSGGTPSMTNGDYWRGDIPWISAASLTSTRVASSDRNVTRAAIGNGTRIAPAGSTLLLVRGMSLHKEIRVGVAMRDVAFNQDVKAINARSGADPGFVYYALAGRRQELLGLVHAAGHGTGVLATDRLLKVPIWLPSLAEQSRIAGVLGAIDDLIEANRAEAARLVLLAQSILSGGDAGAVVVSDVATLSRGLSYKGSGLVARGTVGSVPMVNLANFTTNGWASEDGLKYYGECFKERHLLLEDDLLIANTDLTQRREILGRAVLVQPSLVGAIYSHHTSVVRFTRDGWLRLFLWAQTQGPTFRERAMGYATGTTVAALPKEAVLDFAIRLPADPEQVADGASTLILEAWSREDEMTELTRTRDELLPLLLAGKVRVSEDLAVA